MSSLGLLYSLGKFEQIGGMASWSISLFHVVDRVRTPVKDLVDAGAEHVFAFYLEDHVDEELTINGAEERALHEVAHMNLKTQRFMVVRTVDLVRRVNVLAG